MKKRIIFIFTFILIFFILGFFIFSPLYNLKNVYISYGFLSYDINEKQPQLWLFIKICFIISSLFNLILISNAVYSNFIVKTNHKKINNPKPQIEKNDLQLFVGKNAKNETIFIEEKGLYQNMIITGTIGSGKTSSAMYPFTKQLIYFNNDNPGKKIGMLILDVKPIDYIF